MWDANVGTTTRILDAAEAADDAADRLRLDRQRLRQHPRPGRRRDVPARPRRGLPELVRRDEVRRPRGRRAADRGGRPDRDRDAEPGATVPATTPRSAAQLAARHGAARCRTRRRPTWASALVHVDDLAAGIVAALDRGRVGRSYVLSGPTTHPARSSALEIAAEIGGTKPPAAPDPERRSSGSMAPLGRLIGQPNLARDRPASSAGVTYWASSQRAEGRAGLRPARRSRRRSATRSRPA